MGQRLVPLMGSTRSDPLDWGWRPSEAPRGLQQLISCVSSDRVRLSDLLGPPEPSQSQRTSLISEVPVTWRCRGAAGEIRTRKSPPSEGGMLSNYTTAACSTSLPAPRRTLRSGRTHSRCPQGRPPGYVRYRDRVSLSPIAHDPSGFRDLGQLERQRREISGATHPTSELRGRLRPPNGRGSRVL